MRLSPRLAFAGSLSVLSAPAAALTAFPTLSWQADRLSDLAKIGGVAALGSAVIGFCVWTLVQRGHNSPARGAVAGALTASFVLPLPLIAFALKAGLATPSLALFQGAVMQGLSVFEHFTKASLAAVISTAGLGYGVARWGPRAQR